MTRTAAGQVTGKDADATATVGPAAPLPEYVESAILALTMAYDLDNSPTERAHLRTVLRAAIRRYAEDPRPAGCVCPVERVVHVLAGCAMHGERKP